MVEGDAVEAPFFPSPARAKVPVWAQALDLPEHHTYKLDARGGGPLGIEWLIDGRESIDIGLVPSDVGSWMMHCHILEHAEAGMMTMIDVTDGAAPHRH